MSKSTNERVPVNRKHVKQKIEKLLSRRSPQYARLTSEQKALVEIILGPQSSCGDRAERIYRFNNDRAGCQLYEYVHIDALSEIIEKLAT